MVSYENIDKTVILTAVDSRLVTLHGVWKELGLDEATQLSKSKSIHRLLLELLDAKVEEEINAKEYLLNRLEVNTKIAVSLSRELEVNFQEPDSQLVLVKYEQAVRDEAIRLKAMRDQRLSQVSELVKQDEELCQRLCMEPFHLSPSRVPSSQQVNGLTEHIRILEAEKETRFQQFLNLKKSINEMYEELELGPETAMEREVICEMAEGFILSSSNLSATHSILEKLEERREFNVQRAKEAKDRLNYLYELLGEDVREKTEFLERTQGHTPSVIEKLDLEVARLEAIKKEKIEKLVLSKRADLRKLWDVCFYNEKQRNAFLPLNSSDFTEKLLEQHDDELKRLENHYEKTKEVLTKVHQREQVWGKFKELERLEGDPSRLINARGNSLLLEEKERNKVNKALPRLESELREVIAAWEEQNGEEFLLAGLTFSKFLESQMEEHLLQLDADKRARESAKDAPNSDVNTSKHRNSSISLTSGSSDKRAKALSQVASSSDVKPLNKRRTSSTSLTSASAEKKSRESAQEAPNPDIKNLSALKYKVPSTSVSSRGSSGSLSKTPKKCPEKFGSLPKAGRISKVSSPRTQKANRSKLRKGIMMEQLVTNDSGVRLNNSLPQSSEYTEFKNGSRLNLTEISAD